MRWLGRLSDEPANAAAVRENSRPACIGEVFMNRSRFLSIASVFILLLSTSLFAAEGRIPISASGTIASSGSYILTQDFTGTITVNVSHVTIDLDGHTITVPSGATGVSGSGYTDITVKNGKISGGDWAISMHNSTAASEFRVEDMNITGATFGIEFSGDKTTGGIMRATVLRNVVSAGTSYPLTLFSVRGSTIRGNQMRGGIYGIWMQNSDNNVIDGNVVAESTDYGIYLVNSTYNTIANNSAGGYYGSAGLRARKGLYLKSSVGNTVTYNNFSNNSEDGILLETGCHGNDLKYNTTTQNATGIHLTSYSNYNTIDWNACSQNTAYGIFIDGSHSNDLKYNTVAANGSGVAIGCGILLSGGSAYNTIDWNECSQNKTYGIRFDASAWQNIYSFNRSLGNGTGNYSDAGTGNINAVYAGSTNLP